MINLIARAVLFVALGTSTMVAPAVSRADERCRQLEALRTQYSGVQLTADQKELKIKLVAWYADHCGSHEVADAKPTAVVNAKR